MILRDLYCPGCGHERTDVFVEGDAYPYCKSCGTRMRNHITKINADITGGPFYHPALDMDFASKSDYRAHLKSRNLMECGDKVGGARNQEYLGLGKRFSYRGNGKRSGSDYAETRKHRVVSPLVGGK